MQNYLFNIEFFVNYLSPFIQMLGLFRKLGHNRFYPHRFQLSIFFRSLIRGYQAVLLTTALNKLQNIYSV
jgi:hypothetical protein